MWNSRVTSTEASAWSNIIFLLTQSHSVANTMGQIYSFFFFVLLFSLGADVIHYALVRKVGVKVYM